MTENVQKTDIPKKLSSFDRDKAVFFFLRNIGYVSHSHYRDSANIKGWQNRKKMLRGRQRTDKGTIFSAFCT